MRCARFGQAEGRRSQTAEDEEKEKDTGLQSARPGSRQRFIVHFHTVEMRVFYLLEHIIWPIENPTDKFMNELFNHIIALISHHVKLKKNFCSDT